MASETDVVVSARLFFALWPPAGVGRSLHRVAERVADRCGGRVLAQDSMHLTLAFLGEVSISRQAELFELASSVKYPAVDVRLDCLGYWKHNQILWAGCREPAPALLTLAAILQEKLLAAAFLKETRPLFPHVSLVRKLHSPGVLPELESFAWSAEELVLARSRQSDQGSVYEAVGRWPLA